MGGGQGKQTAVPYALEGFGPLSIKWLQGFFSIFPHEMVCHGDGLPRASGAECIILLKYNVQSRLNFPINVVMVMIMVCIYASQPYTPLLIAKGPHLIVSPYDII